MAGRVFLARLTRATIALLAAIVALPLLAQAPAASVPGPRHDYSRVAIVTEQGTIELDLDSTAAPVTTANFLRYAKEKRFDGTTFYRSMHLDWGTPPNGLIQGGTQADPKRNRAPIAHEPTNETGLKHEAGVISMARYEPGTAAGDFSILLSPQPSLDADPDAEDPASRPGFAAFGHVVKGMGVVRAIFDAPRSPTAGEGVMKGQMIADPVRILSVREIARPDDEPAAVPKETAPVSPAAVP